MKQYITSKKTKSNGTVTKPVPKREARSVQNYGGGYSLKVSPETCLERFLILGVEGSYYNIPKNKEEAQKLLVAENTKNVLSLLHADPALVLIKVRDIRKQKRAISNDPALYVLAHACNSPKNEIRVLAYDMIEDICGTGTDLFHFLEMVTSLRGWSAGLRKGVSKWYTNKDWDRLVYQTLKYRQRDGWSQKDAIRCAHPSTYKKEQNLLFDYLVNGNFAKLEEYCKYGPVCKGSKQILAFHEIQNWKPEEKSADQTKRLVDLILFSDLTHEMIPTWYKNVPEVQEALLQKMPVLATIRMLPSMTASGLVAPFSSAVKIIVDRITDPVQLMKAGVHPLQVLVASRTYSTGHGFKGSLTWNPEPKIVGALEDTFDLAFKSAPATGKNFMISVDVSGSMSGQFQETPLKYCEAAACIALTMVKREPETYTMCFSDRLNVLGLTKKDTLASATEKTRRFNTGSTNAGLPIEYAIKNKLPVDVFLHITDNDFNSGTHPLLLTEEFRNKMGRPNTRLISVGMIPYAYGIGSDRGAFGSLKEDPYVLDIAGFDSSIPKIIGTFCSDKQDIVGDEEE